MVQLEDIREVRPSLDSEFNPGAFVPRTAAMQDAYEWGKEIHRGQYRLSGEPYFETHCAWVAGLIDKLTGVEAWTIAALLHDSIEDQEGSLDAIRKRYPGMLGMEVAHIVDGVTKISNPRDGSSRDLETLRKIARFRDPGVFLVKLADKSHNVLTLEHMPESKRVVKATEAIRAYAKLAGILNCYRWRRWLEDLAFPHAERETYDLVRSRIDADKRLDVNFINEMLNQLRGIMETAGMEGKVTLTVNGYWQSWQKIRRMARLRKSAMDSFAALNDLVSFRMIISDPDPMKPYELLAHVNRFFGPYLDQDRFDDYIARPQNGYRALQVTIWMPDYGAMEIAIANEEMEGENTWGVIYALKHGKDISEYRPVEIFTPTGGARFLPEGSTVLDAVASIQQENLLDKIGGVKVNGNLAMLSDKVKPGDVVEVVSGTNRQAPHRDWLKFANPATARMLRSVLAVEDLRRAADSGRQSMRLLLKKRGILALEDVEELYPDRVSQLLEITSTANLQDLYAAFGSGALRERDLDQALDEANLSRDHVNWTTVNIQSGSYANRPGVLAKLAGLISESNGNIIRSINNTKSDGSFYFRLVVENLNIEKESFIQKAAIISGINPDEIEVAP